MRRPLDGPGPDAELFRLGIVMDRAVTVIGLVGQHLGRLAQRPLNDGSHGT